MENCKQHALTALDFRDTKLVAEHTVKEKKRGIDRHAHCGSEWYYQITMENMM